MPTIAEFLIERLSSNNVRHITSVPGDFSLAFCDKVSKSNIELIGCTCEANAGFAADAYARMNGIGAVLVTYCVGGFNLINATGGAFAEKSPIVIIAGSPGMKERDSDMLIHHMVGSFDSQRRVFSHITCANTVLNNPETAGYEIDRVLAACKQYSQPVYIELPRDMVDRSIRYDPYAIGTPKEFSSDLENLKEALGEVVEWINKSKRPVILAGVEVARFGLGDALMKFAEQTNIPIATTILGKSVVSERHPLSLGVYAPSCGRDEVIEYVESSDCLIMLGVMMTDMNLGFLPLKNQRRSVVLSSFNTMQIRNHSFDKVWFVDFVKGLMKSKVEIREAEVLPKIPVREYVCRAEMKLRSVKIFDKINSILNANMAVIADIGLSLFGSLDLTVESHHFLSQAFYTSMGFAVPGALGVQTANPKVRPIVIVGDGAFQMTGMEFSTIVRRGLNPIIVVLNNRGYSTERVLKEGSYNNIQDWNFEKIPMVVGGGRGYRVTTEGELEYAFECALESKEATILNCILDPNDFTPGFEKMFKKLSKKI